MVVFFMIQGIAEIVFSLSIRPFPCWGWVPGSGILGVLISVWLLANPGMSLLFPRIFMGVQFLAEGFSIGFMAWTIRKEPA